MFQNSAFSKAINENFENFVKSSRTFLISKFKTQNIRFLSPIAPAFVLYQGQNNLTLGFYVL